MSVINQMLNGLEERGVQVAGGQIRPVREERKSPRLKIVLVLLTVIAAALWFRPWAAKPTSVALEPVKESVKVQAPEKVQQPEKITQPEKVRVLAKASPSDVKKHAAAPADKAHHAASRKLTVKERPPVAATEKPAAAEYSVAALPVKQISVAQQADGEYRRAAALIQQGHNAEAEAGLLAALHLDAGHVAARQSLVAMLLENKRGTEAEQVLQDGLRVKPEYSGFAMLLARLQVQRNDPDQALATLEKFQMQAPQAEYQAFYAALLQRKNRHAEAVEHYQVALKSAPNSGVWLMGCGISLQALARIGDARDYFQRALNSGTLTPELQVFVQQKLKAL